MTYTRDERTPSGVTLSIMDFGNSNLGMLWAGINWFGPEDTLFGDAFAADDDDDTPTAPLRWHVYLICSEGVGYDLATMSPEQIRAHWGQDITFQSVVTEIDRGAAGQIQLEDLIRRFGARLESNYYLWRYRLNPSGE